ncbi:dihydropteroate synthase [Microvirga tunisiensis]|uniref:Dihydropteroate synthase n=1 Tax=Microvirga tunisiensis TaxID=2108360 RepID=A0A5N7MW84_9HYPH|nr:dihydropteroate synthase [Microvirga tunisiensis]MPR13041.1 dihydropteroate synthase [Microvirga tunisiensis]MPR30940.1 dihydropteroate synthase [Microvirga tunisiensis]
MTAILNDLGTRTLIMGVLNVTPDSFSDGGLFSDHTAAVNHARMMETVGADIIDVGGESTRPGHTPVGVEEEQRRVLPVIQALAPVLKVPISIDTYRASTARGALAAGARIVNDIWGFQRDPDMPAVVAEQDAFAIVMHNRAEVDASLDIVVDMLRFFEHSLTLARQASIPDARLILDLGIGFGKTAGQNLEALRRLPELKAMGFPVLVGASRKSVLSRFYDPQVPPRDRLFGTLGAHLAAVSRGADLIRVHDVKAHVEACRVADILLRSLP